MNLTQVYADARSDEDLARVRRSIALRAMLATGMSQREAAQALGISQSAVSQQLRHAPVLSAIDASTLLRAAGPALTSLANELGYRDLGVFGSVARGDARPDSDIDLIVEPPAATSSFAFLRFKRLVEQVLDREVDLITYGGLRVGLDDDIRRETIPL